MIDIYVSIKKKCGVITGNVYTGNDTFRTAYKGIFCHIADEPMNDRTIISRGVVVDAHSK